MCGRGASGGESTRGKQTWAVRQTAHVGGFCAAGTCSWKGAAGAAFDVWPHLRQSAQLAVTAVAGWVMQSWCSGVLDCSQRICGAHRRQQRALRARDWPGMRAGPVSDQPRGVRLRH